MAKKLSARTNQPDPDEAPLPGDLTQPSDGKALREHGLVGDVVFDPPLTPEERRRRGVDVSIEERLEQVRRRLAEGDDGF